MAKKIFCMLVAGLILVALFTACGDKSVKSEPAADSAAQEAKAVDDIGIKKRASYENGIKREDKSATESKKDETPKAEYKDAVSANAIAASGAETARESFSNAILAQRKIIRNADISIEVEDFDRAYSQIKSMISAFGFIQESSVKKEKTYVNGKEKLVTRGIVVIRVDKDKFERILTDIRGLGLLLSENIKSDDVTDKFFDTESRLRLLRYEESRLMEYLKKIDDPDVIFKTESRLTDIRHEIESLTGTLKKWSDMVELSTITINIYEKGVDSNISVAKDNSYWGRLSGGFLDSLKGVVMFCGELLILLAKALPVLVLLGLAAFAGFAAYRRFSRGKNQNMDA